MDPLPLRIGPRDQRARFAQAKPQLPKQPLALAHPQRHIVPLLNERRQRLPIPQVSAHPRCTRRGAQVLLDLAELLRTEAPRSPRPLAFGQPRQAFLLKPPHPVLHRSRSIAQQPTDFRTTHALGHQQYSVQSVVVSRFL